MRTLILGGARSGKSRYAQALAEAGGERRVFIATAEAHDEEMADRIARHVADRGESWRTVESPLQLSDAIRQEAAADTVLLVDCLTLWLSNILLAGRDVDDDVSALTATLSSAPGQLVLVSNEVGMGIVPESALGRAFRDHQGRLNQRVAAACDTVEFVAAGLPLTLKRAAT
ncbi:MAG: bifunctional adenosylcobinamide kinase/adenosylcobinamide-phosphate guanylyltransferase [Pseudomonadota bacterium]